MIFACRKHKTLLATSDVHTKARTHAPALYSPPSEVQSSQRAASNLTLRVFDCMAAHGGNVQKVRSLCDMRMHSTGKMQDTQR
eukprot:6480785-Amphidinium_carterae.2